ncbi:MAG: TonB-dependent receptor [Acidobacteria bacterium]|nr:TonB-dependent receptor [Acidobacteriota bacterium]
MLRNVIHIALLFIALTGLAIAQGPVGTITGTVTDPANAVVPGATVVATNTATGVETTTTTTNAGAYTLPYLPAGAYQVRVTAAGFRSSAADVLLRVAQTQALDIKLEVGAVSEQVTVTGQAEVLDSGSAEIGRYITAQEYKAWPVIVGDGQRQIQQFIFDSLPGTTGDTFKGSINGGQQYSHEILIEGMPIGRADLSGGNNNEFSPSAEAIGEFKLQTGAIGAQYNGGQTAVANFAIRSGTNQLHGSGFYYGKNEAFNAANLNTTTTGGLKAKSREHNYGYSAGGPVYIPKLYDGRNKTFFFTNLEKDSLNSQRITGLGTVPTLDFKKGDFSKLFDPAFTGNPLSGTQAGTDALGRSIRFGQIYDPSTTRRAGAGIVRDAFAGNIIPQSRFDPVAANIIQKIGIQDPTLPSLLRNIPTINGQPVFELLSWGTKADHQVNSKNQLSGYYNHSYRSRFNNGAGRFLPFPGPASSSWQQQITPGHLARLSLTSTLSPGIINRVAAGFNRFLNKNGAYPSTINAGLATAIGLKNLPDTMFPVIRFSGPGSQLQGSSIARMGVGFADASPNGSWIYQDDLTWLRGAHTFRFGYEYKRYFYGSRSLSDAGDFTFSARQTDSPGQLTSTGHAFASFVLGGAYRSNHGIQGYSQGFRQPQHGMYIMDDWKITPRLTLNTGLRWEVIPPFYEVTGRMSEVSLAVQNPEAKRPGALIFGNRFNDTYWKQILPRIGLVWRPSEKMVVRAGYAITSTPPIANNWGYGGFTYGYNASVPTFAGTSSTGFADDPSIYLRNPYPSLARALPNTDPNSANYQDVATTARDANRPGYTQNYNFTIQYQLASSTVLEVAYVGNKGTRVWGGTPGSGYTDYNGLPASLLRMGDVLNETVADNPKYTPFPAFDDGLSVAQALRPYPQYGQVNEQFPYNSNSTYNSLQVTATKHLSKNLGFLAAYTFSKAIGYIDANGPGAYYTSVQDYFNRKLDRSITEFSTPHEFKLTWVYESLVGKGRRWDLGWANAIIGGWQFAGIHGYTSGLPIQVTYSGYNIPVGFAPGIRPDVLSGKQTLGGAPSKTDFSKGVPYLNPAAFAPQPSTGDGVPLRPGTAPRFLPQVRGPHQMRETFRMSKRFYLDEKKFLGIGATADNPFKRTSRDWLGLDIADPGSFGQLVQRGAGRTVQLEVRIEF